MGAEAPVTLYRAADRIQPRRAAGRFARLRVAAMLVLLGIYYAVPWIQLDGRPLVWLDLPGRQFHLAGLLLQPQDLIYLTWLLVIAALTLFLFTTLAGRLWCGYACPQTVWTEAFLWIEHFCEGDRAARIRLDRAPWTARKLARRGAKHVAWLALGLLTGITFVAYFIPARELFPAALHGTLEGWALFWVLFYGFATWGNAGFLREQVCQYMCPYARFQSVMFDRDTLLIAYDAARGEPRKPVARKLSRPAGDCVDCSICVQVCPAGIDIREGLQFECIACAACVDACDGVMDAVGRPRGLIRYGSAREQAGGGLRLVRARSVAYAMVWLALVGGFAASLALRTPLEFDVLRDRHALYRELPGGMVENLYTLELRNKDAGAVALAITATLDDGRTVTVFPAAVAIGPGESLSLPLAVRVPAAVVGARTVTLQLSSAAGIDVSRAAAFIAPSRRNST